MHQLGKTPIQESLKISLLWKQRCSRFFWRLNWKISEHREKIWHSNQLYCLQYFIDPLQQQYFKSLRLSRRWGSWLQCNSWTPSMLQLQGYYTHKKKQSWSQRNYCNWPNYAQRTHTLSVRKAFTRLLADLVIEEKRTPNKKHVIGNNSLKHFIEK